MSNNLLFLNFEAHKPPEFKEIKGKDFIQWGDGKDYKNRYPDFLIDLRNRCGIHNAIINGKVRYIVGQGLKIEEGVNLANQTQLQSWLDNIGEESANELFKKVSDDREMYGGYSVRVVWNKAKDKANLYHIDFSKLRVLKDGQGYAYTKDWKTRKPEDNEDYKIFKDFDSNKKEDKTIVYYKDYRPNLREYPNPSYISGVNYVSADIDISTFVASNTSNGFQGGTLVAFYNGEPTDEAKKKIERDFKNKFGGADKAGGIVLAFNKTDAKGVEITPLSDNGQDERFVNLSKQVNEQIFIAHETPNNGLFSSKSEGGLSNNSDEIRTASENFKLTYAKPRQQAFLELFNFFSSLNGWGKSLYIEQLEEVKEQLSIKEIFSDLTKDERRALFGYKPLEEDKSFSNCNHSFQDEVFYTEMNKQGYSDEELEVIEILETNYNPFTFAVTGKTQTLLGIILDNPKITIEELATLLKETKAEVKQRLNLLKNEGLINEKDGNFTPTNEAEKTELITVYKYVVRPDVPSVKTKSRDFCTNLTRSNRSYTREQINLLVNQFSSDAWTKGGGWYTNPDTGITTPFCRHMWQGRTVKLKK